MTIILIIKMLIVIKMVLFSLAIFSSFNVCISVLKVLINQIFCITKHGQYSYTIGNSTYHPVFYWIAFYIVHSTIFLLK